MKTLMCWMLTGTFSVLLVRAADEAENPLGLKKVHTQGSFNHVPSTWKKIIRDARLGEEVTVVAIEGNFAKVTLSDGTPAYIAKTALIAPQKYVAAPSNEKEMMEMKAQGYEAGRFDPETEAEYKKQKGPQMDAAFKAVDAWEARQAWKVQRAVLGARLTEFHKAGKLGEFAPVK